MKVSQRKSDEDRRFFRLGQGEGVDHYGVLVQRGAQEIGLAAETVMNGLSSQAASFRNRADGEPLMPFAHQQPARGCEDFRSAPILGAAPAEISERFRV